MIASDARQHTRPVVLSDDGRFVLAGSGVLRPLYRVTPFSGPRSVRATTQASRGALEAYLTARFPRSRVTITANGRSALRLALDALRLAPTDVVTILTTSGAHYVSGCVTREIEAVCAWSREVLPATRAVLVIHEFGYPFPAMDRVHALGFPVIEDCCYAFGSRDTHGLLGTRSEFVIFSFPKFFDVPFGGALVSTSPSAVDGYPSTASEDPALRDLIYDYVDPQVAHVADIAAARRRNVARLSALLADDGCTTSFDSTGDVIPGVFLFDAPADADLDALKKTVTVAGVECSVHYQRQAFFVPAHQNLGDDDLAYIAAVVRAGLSRSLPETADA